MTSVCRLCTVVLFITMPVAGTSEEERPATGTATFSEDQYFRLLSRVENLEKRDKDQQAEIDTLRSELNTEKRRTSRLEAKLSWLTVSYGKCRKTNGVKKPADPGSFQKQENEAIHAKDTVRNTRSDKTRDKTTSTVRRQGHVPGIALEQMPVIAVSATLRNHTQHTGEHQIIAFDTVVTNIGGAYHAHAGSVIAPVSGVYVFSASVTSTDGDLHSSIVRNGNIVANLYFGDSPTVILHLNKDDAVGVQSNDAGKRVYGEHYTMFSGFLLNEDQPSVSIIGK